LDADGPAAYPAALEGGLHQFGLLAQHVKRFPERHLAGVQGDLSLGQFFLVLVINLDVIFGLLGQGGDRVGDRRVLPLQPDERCGLGVCRPHELGADADVQDHRDDR
jgi:hypothetical protein